MFDERFALWLKTRTVYGSVYNLCATLRRSDVNDRERERWPLARRYIGTGFVWKFSGFVGWNNYAEYLSVYLCKPVLAGRISHWPQPVRGLGSGLIKHKKSPSRRLTWADWFGSALCDWSPTGQDNSCTISLIYESTSRKGTPSLRLRLRLPYLPSDGRANLKA